MKILCIIAPIVNCPHGRSFPSPDLFDILVQFYIIAPQTHTIFKYTLRINLPSFYPILYFPSIVPSLDDSYLLCKIWLKIALEVSSSIYVCFYMCAHFLVSL